MHTPRHRKCPRHDLHDRSAECDPYCLNPARYFDALGRLDCTDEDEAR